tara:strand:+ start:13263 stop:14006 length:744 start_codon:yes stop_codon:yes gene_type:complete
MSENIEQTWIDYSLGKDLITNGEKAYYSKFSSSETTIRCDKTGCGIYADVVYEAGDIIEEAPVLIIRTTVEDIVHKNQLKDPVLLSKVLVYPTVHEVFNELGHPLILPTGNFFAYKQSLKSNAEVEFDRKFNIITIRAKKQITKSEEIILGLRENKYGFTDVNINEELQFNTTQENKGKEDMGCNCGKKKRNVTRLLDGTENIKKETNVTRTKVPKEKLQENVKFKSMVDGSTLKTIVAKKRSDDKV